MQNSSGNCGECFAPPKLISCFCFSVGVSSIRGMSGNNTFIHGVPRVSMGIRGCPCPRTPNTHSMRLWLR
eukprot:12272592-Heterocapsa_arctica.AAC.1